MKSTLSRSQKVTKFRPNIRSRHPSHNDIKKRGVFRLFPFPSVVRFGSTTEFADVISAGGRRIELNTIQAIRNSSNKRLMKQCFDKSGVRTARWWTYDEKSKRFHVGGVSSDSYAPEALTFPLVAKHIFGSRGRGNTKIDNYDALRDFLSLKKDWNLYIFEVFLNFSKEYRLHVTKDGCFYTCRKMLKSNTDEDKRWYRNDSNCSWFVESNPQFDKPNSWKKIVKESVKALKAVGLDFGAVDVKVERNSSLETSRKNRESDFFIIEINSAPSFGERTLREYKEIIPKLLTEKYEETLRV